MAKGSSHAESRFCRERPGWVTGKDMILALLGRIGVQGARYMALSLEEKLFPAFPWMIALPSPIWP